MAGAYQPPQPPPMPPGVYPYGAGPPGAPPPPPPEGWQPQKPTSGKAIAALICGIAGFLLGALCPIFLPAVIVGLVLGFVAIGETGPSGKRSGRGLAIAGTVVSAICLCLSIGLIAFGLAIAAREGESFESDLALLIDQDVNLIVDRMREYCNRNQGSLYPGGPVLAAQPDVEGDTPSNAPGEAPPAAIVKGALELEHLVSQSEFQTGGRYTFKLSVNGRTTASLVVSSSSGDEVREIEITDAVRGDWVQRFP